MTERREPGKTSLKQHRAGPWRLGSVLQEVQAVQKKENSGLPKSDEQDGGGGDDYLYLWDDLL